MNAADFVATLEGAGFQIRTRADGALAIRPAGAVTPTMREALAAMGPDIAAYLRGRALGVDWSRVSLYDLDRVIEISTPWSDVPLILAPGCRIARDLRAHDPRPGRVWCACEVIDLLLTHVTPEDARAVAEAKLALGAESVSVRAMDRER